MSSSANARSRVVVLTVSDATSLESLGLTGRQFRKFLKEHNVPHARVGRRTIARADLVLAAIDHMSGGAPRPAPTWDEGATVAAAARKAS